MAEIKTVTELMMQKALGNVKPSNIVINKVIKRTQFSNKDNIFAYCPYCVERVQRDPKGDFKKDLSPLWVNLHYIVIDMGDGYGKEDFENSLECLICKKEITEEDFLKCRKPGVRAGSLIKLSEIKE